MPITAIDLHRTDGGDYGISAKVNGLSGDAILDTGAGGVAVFTDRADSWKLDKLADGQIQIYTGMTPSEKCLARSIVVGDVTLPPQPVSVLGSHAVSDEPQTVDTVIGPSSFLAPVLVVDFADQKVFFRRRRRESACIALGRLLGLPTQISQGRLMLNAIFFNPGSTVVVLPPRMEERGIQVGRPHGVSTFKKKASWNELLDVAGTSVSELLRTIDQAWAGDKPAYQRLLKFMRSLKPTAEVKIILDGKLIKAVAVVQS